MYDRVHNEARPPYLQPLALVTAAGCTSWFTKEEPPEVLVTNVTPLESTAFEQRLLVDLRICNPNEFDWQVTGVDFTFNPNGTRRARELGSKELTVPRLGDAVTSAEASTSTFDVLRQVMALTNRQELTYDIKGVLHLKDGRLPFDNSGVLFELDKLSDSPTPRQ